ncbi:MAG: peptide-methionine (R)-S-oxide reductase MsrB [Bacteroidetes bacterium]|nr:peptide-methionine (R)-S-oxide reductase MsrB [Bacteroidota bacterium]MDA1335867.1 peptide-methionine (R)-S-oxide reductase MsrB [Bacteroidota bacterium]
MSDQEKQFPATDEEWSAHLPPEAYRVMRQNGTERPFSSEINSLNHAGSFSCRGCGAVLFEGQSKFDSGCGWPSFDRPVHQEAMSERLDRSHGMVRIEVRCATCDSHLGHLFPDGPTETGNRYCINGICLLAI